MPSPLEKGEGRKLRRARNIVKRWQQSKGSWYDATHGLTVVERIDLATSIKQKRYERACALILAAKLRSS